MKKIKSLIWESKNSSENNFRIAEYTSQIKKGKKGAVLFCVCRGKVTEGLDFSNNLCRAVCLVGIPYPPRFIIYEYIFFSV